MIGLGLDFQGLIERQRINEMIQLPVLLHVATSKYPESNSCHGESTFFLDMDVKFSTEVLGHLGILMGLQGSGYKWRHPRMIEVICMWIDPLYTYKNK